MIQAFDTSQETLEAKYSTFKQILIRMKLFLQNNNFRKAQCNIPSLLRNSFDGGKWEFLLT